MPSARIKMCKGKVTYTTLQNAKKIGKKYNQRAYECPVCFCYHLTSKDNWKDEFVTIEEFEKLQVLLEKEKTNNAEYIKKIQTMKNEQKQRNIKLNDLIKAEAKARKALQHKLNAIQQFFYGCKI